MYEIKDYKTLRLNQKIFLGVGLFHDPFIISNMAMYYNNDNFNQVLLDEVIKEIYKTNLG